MRSPESLARTAGKSLRHKAADILGDLCLGPIIQVGIIEALRPEKELPFQQYFNYQLAQEVGQWLYQALNKEIKTSRSITGKEDSDKPLYFYRVEEMIRLRLIFKGWVALILKFDPATIPVSQLNLIRRKHQAVQAKLITLGEVLSSCPLVVNLSESPEFLRWRQVLGPNISFPNVVGERTAIVLAKVKQPQIGGEHGKG